MGNQSIYKILKNNPLVPVVTFNKEDDPEDFMDYLIKRNVFCIEITLRTEYGLKAIELLKKKFSDTIQVGAGTVISSLQVNQLKSIGADFMVSPGLTVDLFEFMIKSKIPFLPGVATPSEIIKAQELGLEYLKFFPANLYGGIDALKMFGGLFPALKFCPTGGISEATSQEYLALNNVIAVGGSWFQKNYKTK
jgi:2-dehydro-3-deoxyphosphogluconate aldolase/(4S)-4-hydroxy-2-oxoglutarate aldolase